MSYEGDCVFPPLTPSSPRHFDFNDQHLQGFTREAVRVDRRRVERLQEFEYNGEGRALQDANRFIRDLSSETDTEIVWCDQIRSRKDPTIMIYGESSRVKDAKERINAFFNSRQDRVTLKLDVSFDAHSHIIGRGGRSIQRVMDATSTHVHFPDSNRTSTFEKSNQVSIAGTAAGAEKARCQVRDLMPLTIHYELPLTAFNRRAMDTGSVFYQMLQRNFSISVSIQPVRVFGDFFDFGEPSLIKISIRGTRGLVDQMEQGTQLLLEQVTNGTYNLSSTPATCDIEIAVQNHVTVIGRNECNIRKIMQETNAIINFPDQSNVPFIGPAASSLPNRKSTVTIKGPNFNSVFAAWDSLQGYLPLILIFDLNEGQQVDAMYVARLMEKHKVSIQVKPKVRQNVNSIIVKGSEQDSRLLFEVRRELLNLDQSEVPFCCSNHFFKKFSETFGSVSIGNSQPESLPSQSDQLPSPPKHFFKTLGGSSSTQPISPVDQPSSDHKPSGDTESIWGSSSIFNRHSYSVGSYPKMTWQPHNCSGNDSDKTHHDFLTSDRHSILDSTTPRDTLTNILTRAGLGRYTRDFTGLSLNEFINLTPENLNNYPYYVRQQLGTLISQLKWLGDSQSASINF